MHAGSGRTPEHFSDIAITVVIISIFISFIIGYASGYFSHKYKDSFVKFLCGKSFKHKARSFRSKDGMNSTISKDPEEIDITENVSYVQVRKI